MKPELMNFNTRLTHNCRYHCSTESLSRALHEIYFWQYSRADNFTSLLFVLFQKADPGNFLRLTTAFPAEAAVFKTWMETETQQEFFDLASRWVDYWSLPNRMKPDEKQVQSHNSSNALLMMSEST